MGVIGIAVVSTVLLVVAFHNLRRRRLYLDTPTSKVKGVFLGLNEVKGAILCERPLRSRYAQVVCVWCCYEVEEHYRRTRTVIRDGKSHTEVDTGWESISSATRATWFEIEDDTGTLRVDPTGADVKAPQILREERSTRDAGYHDVDDARSVSGSTGRRRFTESALEVGAQLYALGPARLRDDVVAPEMARDKEVGPFVLSTTPEERLARGRLWWAIACLVLVLAGSVGAPMLWFEGAPVAQSTPVPWLIGPPTAVLLLLLGSWLIQIRNGLVTLRQRERRAWSLIDVQLARRADLVPNLVAAVQGYASHEATLQESLAGARTWAGSGAGPDAATVAAGGEAVRTQQTAVRSALAVAERYPALEADAGFRDLQGQLVDTEDRIALAREFFNESVRLLRDRAMQLPGSLIAHLMRLELPDFFLPEGFERVVPVVAIAPDAPSGAPAEVPPDGAPPIAPVPPPPPPPPAAAPPPPPPPP